MPAPSKIDGNSTNGGIGRAKTDNFPEGVTISDIDLRHYTTAQEFENLKDAVIDTEDRVTALEQGTSAAALTRIVGSDDFVDNPAVSWAFDAENGGAHVQGDNAAKYGIPGQGFLGATVSGDASSRALATRALTGLVRDTDKPIVVEWQGVSVLNAGVVTDDECAWIVGAVDTLGPAAGNGVFVFAALDPGRVFKLAILTAGVASLTDITLPALGAGDSYRLRLTISPGSVVLEAATNFDTLAEIETVTAATPAVVYHPALQLERSDGAGNRVLLAGRVTWDGYRDVSAAAAGAAEPFTSAASGLATNAQVQAVDDAVDAVAADLAAHVGVGGGEHPDAIAAGAAGFMSGADKTKLNGIASGAQVCSEANVRTALAAATASIAVNSQKITGLATGTANGDGANVGQVQQPATRSVSGTTDTIVAGDIGNVVFYSQAGGVAAELPDLSGSLIAGRTLVLTLQGTDAATVITVSTPNGAVTIDGDAANFVAATGMARVSLLSLDGLAWYSGTP